MSEASGNMAETLNRDVLARGGQRPPHDWATAISAVSVVVSIVIAMVFLLESLRTDLGGRIDAVGGDLSASNAALNARIEATNADLGARIEASNARTDRLFIVAFEARGLTIPSADEALPK